MSQLSRLTKRVSLSTKEIIRDVSCVLSGYQEFKKSGSTPEEANFSMRRLYRTINGRFNPAMGSLAPALHRKRSVDLNTSPFDDVTPTTPALLCAGLSHS